MQNCVNMPNLVSRLLFSLANSNFKILTMTNYFQILKRHKIPSFWLSQNILRFNIPNPICLCSNHLLKQTSSKLFQTEKHFSFCREPDVTLHHLKLFFFFYKVDLPKMKYFMYSWSCLVCENKI